MDHHQPYYPQEPHQFDDRSGSNLGAHDNRISLPVVYQYITYQNAKKRGKFLERDEANDRRAFELAENCNQAMSKLAQAVEANTKAIEENGKAVAEMVNLLRAKVIQ